MPITRVAAFLDSGYIQVIKQLPDSRFARLKDNYAHNMQHPAIAIFNRDLRKRSIAVTWVENALDLSISPSVIERIQDKLDELNRIQRKNHYPLNPVPLIVSPSFLLINNSYIR